MLATKLNHDKSINLVLVVFILINTIVLLSVRFLPFIDLPNHLAEAAIYKYHGNPAFSFSEYYSLTPWYFPNTFHTVFCTFFPSVEFGNKVFHILYIIALQLSVMLVIRHLKGNPWYGLLSVLFTYNYNLTFGFVGFTMAIPVTIFLFYCTLLDIERSRYWLKGIVAFLLVLLFLMHAQMALFGLALYGMMMLYHYRSSFAKLLVHGILVPLPVVLLIFYWWFTRTTAPEPSTTGYLLFYYTERFYKDFYLRFGIFVMDNFPLQDGLKGLVIAGFFSGFLILPLIHFGVHKKISREIFKDSRFVYALIFLFVASACYFFLPHMLPGQSPLYQRFCTIVMLAFIIMASLLLRDVNQPYLKKISVGVIALYLFLWMEYIITFNIQNRDFAPSFFQSSSKEARLAGLIYDNEYRGRQVYIHFPNYFLVWKKGVVASKIIDYRFGIVRRVAPESVIPFYHEFIGAEYTPRPRPRYNHLEYILVRGTAPDEYDLNRQQFSLANSRGPWKLYRNNSPQANNQ